jgi:hypothetical protein
VGKAPNVALIPVRVGKTLVGAQILWVLRTTIASQVGGGCHDKPTHVCNVTRDERLVFHDGDAQGGIEAFSNQIGMGIREMEIHGNIRVGPEKFGQLRGNSPSAKSERRSELDETTRSA